MHHPIDHGLETLMSAADITIIIMALVYVAAMSIVVVVAK